MLLPYSIEVYIAAMAAYNAAWWPAVALGALLALRCLGMALVPKPAETRAGIPAQDRAVAVALAVMWIWCGGVHQLGMMAGFDFMAPWYGVGMLVQGGLLALVAAGLPRRRFRFRETRFAAPRAFGVLLVLFGLLGWPLALVASHGADWPALPLAGTAPDPTVIVTAGLLLSMRPAPPLHLFVIPLAWAGVAAVSGYLLGFWPDYLVTAAVPVAFLCALRLRQGAR